MFELQLILMVGVLIYSGFSLVGYYKRRSRGKVALRDISRTGQPLRTLTDEEHRLLKRYLARESGPELTGNQVHRISGAYIRHGITSTGGGDDVMHDTIGGIEVLLPYDAAAYLEDYNNAEVVLTPKVAIVVKLNDGFDLAGARQREKTARERQARWAAGKTGDLTVTTRNAEPEGETDAPETIDIAPVRIIAQREETANEVISRTPPGLGWMGATLLLVAFGLLLAGGHSENILPWLLPAAALFALGQWLLWRRRQRAIEPRNVNHVQGELMSLRWQGGGGVGASTFYSLGTDVSVDLPQHWQRWLPHLGSDGSDLDVRVSDTKILRIGKVLSLDAEVRRFPLVYWCRHALLALAGAAMLLIAWLANDHIALDWAHVTAGQPVVLTQADTVMARPPSEGTMVRIQAQVRCEIPDPRDRGVFAPVDCHYVRWGGAAPRIPDLALDPAMAELRDGKLVREVEDPRLEMLLLIQTLQNRDFASHANRPSVRRLDNFSDLVLASDRACPSGGNETSSACRRLKSALVDDVVLLSASPETDDWNSLVEHSRNGKLREGGDHALTATRTVAALRSLLVEVSDEQVRASNLLRQQEAWASQVGGMVLPLSPGGLARLEQSAPHDIFDSLVRGTAGQSDSPWQRWASYQMVASEKGLWPLDLTGMVVHYSAHDGGEALLEIDIDRTPATVGPATLRTSALLMGLALLLIHGTLGLLNRYRAKQREKAIDAYYAAEFGPTAQPR